MKIDYRNGMVCIDLGNEVILTKNESAIEIGRGLQDSEQKVSINANMIMGHRLNFWQKIKRSFWLLKYTWIKNFECHL